MRKSALLLSISLLGFWCCAAGAELLVKEDKTRVVIRNEYYSITFDKTKGGRISELAGRPVEQLDVADLYAISRDSDPKITVTESPKKADLTVRAYYVMRGGGKTKSELCAEYRYTFHADSAVVGCKATLAQNVVLLYADLSAFPEWPKVSLLDFGDKAGFRGPFGGGRKDFQIFLKPAQKDPFDVPPQERDGYIKMTLPDVGRGERLLAESFKDNRRWTDISGRWVCDGKKLAETSQAAQWAWTAAGERTWDNYIVEADVLSTGGESHISVCARWLDADNHYELEVLEWPAYCMRINRVRDGRRVKLAEVLDVRALTIPPSTRLALAVRGPTLTAYRDGEQVLEAYDGAFTQGRIALGAAGIHPTQFLGVDAYSLQAEAAGAPRILLSQPVPSRHAFYREEGEAAIAFLVSSEKPVEGLQVDFALREDLYPTHGGLLRQTVDLEPLAPGKQSKVTCSLLPALWRSGDYSLDVAIRQGSKILAQDTTPVFLRRKPNSDRFSIGTFYPNDPDRAVALGFNQVKVTYESAQTRWANGKWGYADNPLHFQGAELQAVYDRFDECIRSGAWGVVDTQYALLIPTDVPDALALKRDGSGLQDQATGTHPAGMPHVNLWNSAVINNLKDYFGKAMQAYKDLPACHEVTLSGESDHRNEVYGNADWLAMARKELGFDVPADVRDSLGPRGRELPKNGIVENDDPYYRFYRWWWKRGAGYGMLHASVAEAIKKVRPDVETMHEPALRQPFVLGRWPGLDRIQSWVYSWPNVARMSMEADQLRLIAGAEREEASIMFQLYAWGACAIPRSAAVWPYVKKPDYHLAHSPDVIREAVWLAFARGIGGMAFDGLAVGDPAMTETIFPTSKGDVRAQDRGFGYHYLLYANPDLVSAVKDLNFGLLQPYGTMVKHLNPPPAEVAFLLSNANVMMTLMDAESFAAEDGGMLYAKLQAAHVPVKVVFDETIEKDGLDGYKAIALPGCRVMSRQIYEKVKTFAEKGGIVIADQNLVPELPNVTRLPHKRSIFSATGAELQQVILEQAAEVRKLLDGKITRWSDCDSASVALHELDNGPTRLLFVINTLQRAGDYVGHWGRVLDDGVAQTVKVRIRRSDVVIYDVLAQTLVKPSSDGEWLTWNVALEPGGGRMYAVAPAAVGAIAVSVAAETGRPSALSVRAQISATNERPFPGLTPVRVTIKDSQGIVSDYSDYYMASDGIVSFTVPIAKNDPSGDWTVTLKELFGGKEGTAFFTVSPAEKVAKVQDPKEFVQVPEMWLFRTDPGNVGEKEKWFAPGRTNNQWRSMSTYSFWDSSLKEGYIGNGWYAVDLTIPAAPGKKVWMVFGAVDENYTLWINGDCIGNNLDAGTTLWDKPVEVDITGRYKPGEKNHIVVRVKNTEAAGGIWKPVRIVAAE